MAKRTPKDTRHFRIIPCSSCKGTGMIWSGANHTGEPEGACAYCNGEKKRKEIIPHPSHKLTKWASTILAPCGTPRFYSIRKCSVCHEEEWQAAAGHFLHRLPYKCTKKPRIHETIGYESAYD